MPTHDLSLQLQRLAENLPDDLKAKCNGMSFAQRCYVMAQAIAQSPPDDEITSEQAQALLSKAEEQLITWGIAAMRPTRPDIAKIEESKDNPRVRELLVKMIMAWRVDWRSIINQHVATQFLLGANRWVIVGHEQVEVEDAVTGDRVHCIALTPRSDDVFNSTETSHPVGTEAFMLIHQVEEALGIQFV